MYGKQQHPRCMNMFTYLSTKRMLAGGLVATMAQQLLRIRPFAVSGLTLADSFSTILLPKKKKRKKTSSHGHTPV